MGFRLNDKNPSDIISFFFRLRDFQHGPSKAHIKAQPITPTARLARDTNLYLYGI